MIKVRKSKPAIDQMVNGKVCWKLVKTDQLPAGVNLWQALYACAYRRNQKSRGSKKATTRFFNQMKIFINDKLRNIIKINSIFFDIEKRLLILYTVRLNELNNMLEDNPIKITLNRGIMNISPQIPLTAAISNAIKQTLLYSFPVSMLPPWASSLASLIEAGVLATRDGKEIEYEGRAKMEE